VEDGPDFAKALEISPQLYPPKSPGCRLQLSSFATKARMRQLQFLAMKSREVGRDVRRVGGHNAMVTVALETYFPPLAAKK